MQLREQCGGVHHGDEGSAGSSGFASKERTVGDDAGDGAANFGVAEVSFRAQVFTFGGVEMALRACQRGLVADLCMESKCCLAMS